MDVVLTVGVLLLVSNLLAQELFAGRSVTTASLSVQGLTAISAEPLGERLPCVIDVVRSTVRVGTSTRLSAYLEDNEIADLTSCQSPSTCGHRR